MPQVKTDPAVAAAPKAAAPKAAAVKPAKPSKPTKAAAAEPVKRVKAVKPVKPVKAVKPAKPVAEPAPLPAVAPPQPKVKLVRDSFTIPELEYAQLEALKRRALGLAHHAKKSELLRAGIATLAAMDDAALLAALQSVPPLKTGRPKTRNGGKKS
jgi:hypothetical protein